MKTQRKNQTRRQQRRNTDSPRQGGGATGGPVDSGSAPPFEARVEGVFVRADGLGDRARVTLAVESPTGARLAADGVEVLIHSLRAAAAAAW